MTQMIHQICLTIKSSKPVNLNDFHHQSRSQSHLEKVIHKERSSNFQSSNKIREMFDLPDTSTVYGSPTSSKDRQKSTFYFSQSQGSNKITLSKHKFWIKAWKMVIFFPFFAFYPR